MSERYVLALDRQAMLIVLAAVSTILRDADDVTGSAPSARGWNMVTLLIAQEGLRGADDARLGTALARASAGVLGVAADLLPKHAEMLRGLAGAYAERSNG